MLIDYPFGERLTAIARDYPDGAHVPPHRHSQAQFLYAAEGLMRLVTAEGAWVIPPTRAVWIPPQVEHEIFMSGAVRMRTLYLSPQAEPAGLEDCCVLAVTALLRELILRAMDSPDGEAGELVERLLLLEIASLRHLPLALPFPADRRLRGICLALLQRPEHPHTLEDWGLEVGASARTLARLFRQELGMSFQEWRQQLRLTEALPRLLAGVSVQRIASELGYGSARAFSAMFKRLVGENPREYVQGLKKDQTL